MKTRYEVAVCVATYRRPAGLKRLLAALGGLERHDLSRPLRVAVVNNDPLTDVKDLRCRTEVDNQADLVVEFVTEPSRGIPQARNRALDLVLDEAEFIAFIDDDEWPCNSDWLCTLLECASEFEADVVAGPVVPHYDVGVPHWVVEGRFFVRPRYATGTELTTCATNNVLIRCSFLRASDLRFDSKWALTGGSDTAFFDEVYALGGRIIWCDQAPVCEEVPRSRATRRWLVRRAFRGGLMHGRRMLEDSRTPNRRRLRLLVAGSLQALAGAVMAPIAHFRGQSHGVRSLQLMSAGVGKLLSFLRFDYNEYRDV